ncbi:hypothetical protein L7F22_048665 [Adiantum nelumboides]|nr:hypothetical protein [Adiantum nelumboides]
MRYLSTVLLVSVFVTSSNLPSLSSFSSEANVFVPPSPLLTYHVLPPIGGRPPPVDARPKDHHHVTPASPHQYAIRATSPSPSTTCKPTYGMLPCTRSIIGGIFLLAVYGYIIFTAARFLAQGSELLLLVLDANIVGGLLLPIFGVLPDAILVLGMPLPARAC